MTITRANVEFAKRIGLDRVGNDYVYGGNWNPFDLSVGTDCSGVVVDICDATRNGTAMAWTRHGMSTETWRLADDPNNGPFGAVRVSHPSEFPADAVVKMAFAHYGGGANSHTWCEVDGVRFESHGSTAKYPNGRCVTGAEARDVNDTSYANDWWYIPGPISEDGTPVTEPADTLYADVSEWQQSAVSDAYTQAGYRVLCIRSNDGTYRDRKWEDNYAWCKTAVDEGQLAFFIVYFVWRPNWQDAVATLKSQIGQPHPRMAIMLDVESWNGQIRGDQSAGINAAFEDIAAWLGDRRRVIGYGNTSDLNTLWRTKPAGVRLVIAAYGSNPDYPGKIAHQYTDGQGHGDGLPEGAPPFGNCDMNSADGLTAAAFAAALGIGAPTPPAPPPAPVKRLPQDLTDRELLEDIWTQLRGPGGNGWPQLGKDSQGRNLTPVDAIAKLLGPGA